MLPIIWSSKALDDLDDIVAFIGSRDGAAALRLQQQIEEAVAPVSSYPYMFRPGRVSGTREIVAHPNYIVIYRIAVDMILVTAVLHTRRKYP